MTILVFDSGIGGLTVLREARVLLPNRRFVYVADDAGFPYGDWEEDALRNHIVDLFGELLEAHRPQLSVIACNTASTLAIDALRSASMASVDAVLQAITLSSGRWVRNRPPKRSTMCLRNASSAQSP